MRAEYDFTDSKPNPYAKKERKAVTIRLDLQAIDYFKDEADRTGIPYQSLINLYLLQCAKEQKHLAFA
ncbi:MAG: BrnA antitoxin family protein [Eggerthellaceae bacterium]|nr:BrnA antitoxin family protein [Eggerthellaceae bacterium]